MKWSSTAQVSSASSGKPPSSRSSRHARLARARRTEHNESTPPRGDSRPVKRLDLPHGEHERKHGEHERDGGVDPIDFRYNPYAIRGSRQVDVVGGLVPPIRSTHGRRGVHPDWAPPAAPAISDQDNEATCSRASASEKEVAGSPSKRNAESNAHTERAQGLQVFMAAFSFVPEPAALRVKSSSRPRSVTCGGSYVVIGWEPCASIARFVAAMSQAWRCRASR